MPFYAVARGKKPDIYETWGECSEQVKGFSGAIYKKFSLEEDAIKFMRTEIPNFRMKNEAYTQSIETTMPTVDTLPNDTIVNVETINDKDRLYAYVDGSYNEASNIVGYGLVLVQNDKVLFKDLGYFKGPNYTGSRNVFGEIRGAMKAVEMCIANGFTNITIAYDYAGIEEWAMDRWKANLPLTTDYKNFMLKYRQKIDISFLKIKAHSGQKYNEMADKLAKIGANL